jgi:hypothetical protein
VGTTSVRRDPRSVVAPRADVPRHARPRGRGCRVPHPGGARSVEPASEADPVARRCWEHLRTEPVPRASGPHQPPLVGTRRRRRPRSGGVLLTSGSVHGASAEPVTHLRSSRFPDARSDGRAARVHGAAEAHGTGRFRVLRGPARLRAVAIDGWLSALVANFGSMKIDPRCRTPTGSRRPVRRLDQPEFEQLPLPARVSCRASLASPRRLGTDYAGGSNVIEAVTSIDASSGTGHRSSRRSDIGYRLVASS